VACLVAPQPAELQPTRLTTPGGEGVACDFGFREPYRSLKTEQQVREEFVGD